MMPRTLAGKDKDVDARHVGMRSPDADASEAAAQATPAPSRPRRRLEEQRHPPDY